MSVELRAHPSQADAIDARVRRLLQDSRRELAAYRIVDSPREPSFDNLAELAARITGWPIALISFFDGSRQWYKSSIGIELEEDDAAASFCLNILAHGHERLYVADAPNDERFRDNPYVCGEPGIRGYVGIPIRSREGGVTVGTLAVCNTVSAVLDEATFRSLALVAEQIETLLELRREDHRRRLTEHRLATANRQLESFARTIAHDLRAPLRHQSELCRILRAEFSAPLPAEAQDIVARLERSADESDGLLRELLDYALIADAASAAREDFLVRSFLEEVLTLANPPQDFACSADSTLARVSAPRVALKHIALNLVTNAVKHHDRAEGRIDLTLELEGLDYVLCVRDDGPGIPTAHLSKLYAPKPADQGLGVRLRRGVGTYIVAELVGSLGGDVEVLRNRDREDSADGLDAVDAFSRGTTVCVRWPAL